MRFIFCTEEAFNKDTEIAEDNLAGQDVTRGALSIIGIALLMRDVDSNFGLKTDTQL